jgi:2-hydroxy-3-keto-5-methylthiopentenyl-1-phosphate phosphatase
MSSRAWWHSPMRCSVLVDFDGTIAPDDPTDRLFERFADPRWRNIEKQWQAGQISSRECMVHQVSLLRATPTELDREICKFRIDPSFPDFLHFCQSNSVEVKIVSDGFNRVVQAVLEIAKLAVPYFANNLEWLGGDRWRLGLPYSRTDCRVDGGNCKCSHGNLRPSISRVVIGDGRSDFCMSTRADLIIAKGPLLALCRDRSLACESFNDFGDVTAHLAAWLGK